MPFHTVILSYNHPEITARCLQSVLKLRNPEAITLVHNGSQIRFVDHLRSHFPQIEHLIIEKNLGFAGGANIGLSAAFQKSPWVLFVTNDCELTRIGPPPNRPGLYSPLIYLRNTGRIDSVMGRFDAVSGRLAHVKETEPHSGAPYVPGTSFLLHRDVFAEVGGFDETLFTYWEDVDLSQRVRRHGHPVQHVGQFSLLHRVGKTCHKNKYYTSYLFHRNRSVVSRRYCPISQRPLLEAILFKDWVTRSLTLAKHGRWSDLMLHTRAYLRPGGFLSAPVQ